MGHEIGQNGEIPAEPLKLAELKKMSEGPLNRLLRSWIGANRGNLKQIGAKHVDAIRRLINSRKSGKIVEIPGGSTIEKQGGMLVFNNNNIEKAGPEN